MKRILALILILMLSFSALAAEKPMAVSRGGTIVIRIPYKWINSQELGPSWWGMIGHPIGHSKEEVLFPILPPDKVAEWVLQDSMEEELIRIFAISSVDSKALAMNGRPLNDSWYAVIRPEKKFGDSFDLHWSISEWGVSMADGAVEGDLKLDQETQVMSLKVDSMDGIKAAWKKSCDGFGMTLFHVEDVYIAVIEEKNARKDDLAYAQLYIDAPDYDFDYFFVRMEGYMDGKTGVYCCVLSEDEFDMLKGGADVRLEHDHSK